MRNVHLCCLVAGLCLLASRASSAQGSDSASRLLQARSIRCEWGQGTQASWQGDKPSLEQGPFGKDPTVTFDSIDIKKGTARVIGNAGAFDVAVLRTPVGLTFIEQGRELIAGLSFTTVFTSTVDRDISSRAERAQGRPDTSSFIAVISRHLDILGTVAPSQYHGTCRILQ